MRILLFLCAAVACSIAAVRELYVWRSDLRAKDSTPEHLALALTDTPSDAGKWRQLGIALLQQQPEASAAAFQRAIRLNPFETEAYLGLAIQAEARGDRRSAEPLYLRACQSSRRLKPALALAGFYARAGRMDEFWQTARVAAAIDKADVERVFRLADATGTDPNSILSLLNLRTDHALETYARISASENRLVPLAQAAMRLPATPKYEPTILMACDRLIAAGAAEAAVELWNRIGAFRPLDAARGQSLTNPTFTNRDVSGFNWRLYNNPGVAIQYAARGLSIDFSGEQRQQVLLLEQAIPLLARRNYRLSVDSESAELTAADGLSWVVQCLPWRQTIASAAIVKSAASTTSVTFSTPAECNLASAMLVYTRQPGTVRISGTLSLLDARLELIP